MAFKFFSSKPDMSVHMLENSNGTEHYAEIDTNLTRWQAGKVVNDIAVSLHNTKVNEADDFVEIEGYTQQNAKVVLAAYKQGAIDL